LLVTAALAQNKSIDSNTLETLSKPSGDIDWSTVFNQPNTSLQPDAQLRQTLTGYTYNTNFMLLLYIKDLRELYSQGWALPDGITETDLDDLEKLANTKPQK
jgi:hypothetical protein